MKREVTVDPGTTYYAAAYWFHDVLQKVEFYEEGVHNVEPRLSGGFQLGLGVAKFGAERVVVECPQIRDAQHQKGDQRDIRDLALAAGALGLGSTCAKMIAHSFGVNLSGTEGSWFTPVQYLEPREWKGTVAKPVMCRRIWDHMTEEERNVFRRAFPERSIDAALKNAKNAAADGLDAVGIGFFLRGRLKTRRTR